MACAFRMMGWFVFLISLAFNISEARAVRMREFNLFLIISGVNARIDYKILCTRLRINVSPTKIEFVSSPTLSRR